MDSNEFVRAVCVLRDKQGFAPTSGDVAAQVGVSRATAWRHLKAAEIAGLLYSVPGNPAPTWHIRGDATQAVARVEALVREAGDLVRGLDDSAAAWLRAQILDALDGREVVR